MVPFPWIDPVGSDRRPRPDRGRRPTCWCRTESVRRRCSDTAAAVLAPVYIGLPLGALVAIAAVGGPRSGADLDRHRRSSATRRRTMSGRTFGRRPLAPRRSPKKTIEGAIGGFVVAPIALLLAGARVAAWHLAARGWRLSACCSCAAGHDRRPVRIDAEARGRPERQQRSDSRPRRRARSHRRAARSRRRSSTSSSDDAHRDPRIDGLDRHQRPVGRGHAPGPPSGGRASPPATTFRRFAAQVRKYCPASSRWRPATGRRRCARLANVRLSPRAAPTG